MHKEYRDALIRAVYPDENRPEWVADDPLAKDAAQRIAELERELERERRWLRDAYEAREEGIAQGEAEERDRIAHRIEERYGTGIIGAREIADFVRALGDE